MEAIRTTQTNSQESETSNTEPKVPTIQPRIYVACLSAYNAGCLHGAWIDAAQPVTGIMDEILQMLATSPQACAEEWAIHDSEGFDSVIIDQWEEIGIVSSLACLITEHGDRVVAAVWDHANGNPHRAQEILEEQYQGSFDDIEDWAHELLESTGDLDQVPTHLRGYIDCEAYARDLELNGDIFTVEQAGKLHVFWAA